jgi:hypothetical protein
MLHIPCFLKKLLPNFLKIQNFFVTFGLKKKRRVGHHFAHKVGGPIIVTNSPREQKKNKVNVCSISIK